MLWLNSCVGLLLSVAMVHINCKHTLCCIYAKDNTKEQHVVFGYKHTLWDSQSCALMLLQMLCR